jgi:hypothetical protein
VQVDPIKPTLKAPETNLLTLEYDGPLSNFAFKTNLRRYNVVHAIASETSRTKGVGWRTGPALRFLKVRRCKS